MSQLSPSPESPSPIATAGIDFSKAWPNLKPRSIASTTWVEVSIAPDGTAAFGEERAAAAPYAPLGPAILDRSTGKISIIRPFTNPRAQVVWIVGDATWVVWVEGSLEPTFADWVLYSFNRESRQVRTLAAAQKPYLNTPNVVPSMSNGVIVYSAIEAADGIEHVYAINADGTDPRVLEANALGPQVVWPWMVYDSISTSSRTAHGTLKRLNLQTGETQPIAGPIDVSYYAYDGESLAWISGDTSSVWLQSPISSPPTQVFAGAHMDFISLNRRLIGWGQVQGAMVFDRKLRVAVQLSNLGNYYPAISSQAIDWLYQPDPNSNRFSGTVYELADVSQLP